MTRRRKILSVNLTSEEAELLDDLSQFVGWKKSQVVKSWLRRLFSLYHEAAAHGVPKDELKLLMQACIKWTFPEYQIDKSKRILRLRIVDLDEQIKLLTFKKLLTSYYHKIKPKVKAGDKVKIEKLRNELKTTLGINENTFNDYLKKLYQQWQCILEEGKEEEGLHIEGKNFVYIKELKED